MTTSSQCQHRALQDGCVLCKDARIAELETEVNLRGEAIAVLNKALAGDSQIVAQWQAKYGAAQEQIKELRMALERIVSDFETDYTIDGTVVDDPSETHRIAWEVAGAALKNHFRKDGTCDCPFDGKCIECGKPCNDHDLVADYHWCSDCLDRSFEKYGRKQVSNEKSPAVYRKWELCGHDILLRDCAECMRKRIRSLQTEVDALKAELKMRTDQLDSTLEAADREWDDAETVYQEGDALKAQATEWAGIAGTNAGEIDALKAEVARLSAPVSMTEIPVGERIGAVQFNRIIAARATPPQNVEKGGKE